MRSIAILRGRAQTIREGYCLEKTKSFEKRFKKVLHWTDHWFYVNRLKNKTQGPFYYERDWELGAENGN